MLFPHVAEDSDGLCIKLIDFRWGGINITGCQNHVSLRVSDVSLELYVDCLEDGVHCELQQ